MMADVGGGRQGRRHDDGADKKRSSCVFLSCEVRPCVGVYGFSGSSLSSLLLPSFLCQFGGRRHRLLPRKRDSRRSLPRLFPLVFFSVPIRTFLFLVISCADRKKVFPLNFTIRYYGVAFCLRVG